MEEPAFAYERIVRVEVRAFAIVPFVSSDLQCAVFPGLVRSYCILRSAASIYLVKILIVPIVVVLS